VAPARTASCREEEEQEPKELEEAATSAAKQGKPAATATLGKAASAVSSRDHLLREAVAAADVAEHTVGVAAGRAARPLLNSRPQRKHLPAA
jgi:hypothetical protein